MSLCLYISLWKRLYNCRKADCGLNDIKEHVVRYFIANEPAIKIGETSLRQCERTQCIARV